MTVIYIGVCVFLAVVYFSATFGKRFYEKSAKEKTIKQCSYGSAEIANVLKDTSDYDLLKSQFSGEKNFQERYLISVSVSRVYPIELLERWVIDEPDSADALLCYGARLVQWSWDARGYGRGSDVSRAAWDEFFKRLAKTRAVLMKCTEAMPSDPTPWAYLIIVSTVSGDDHDDRAYYFEQAVERDPLNWPAHMHRVIALSEKWGGDNRAMIKFAEEASNNAPEGSDLAAILIKAYIENWKYLDMFEDKPAEAKQFLNSADIQAKAVAAYQRSLGSSLHKDTANSIFARYNTSSWFWMVKDKLRLKQDLSALGGKIEDIHWRWAGSEGDLSKAKKFAGVR